MQKRFNPFLKDNDQQFHEHFDAPHEDTSSSDDKNQYDDCNNLTNVITSTSETLASHAHIESSSNFTESLEEAVTNLSISDHDANITSTEDPHETTASCPTPAVPHPSNSETSLESKAKSEDSTEVAERLDKHQPDEHLADWIVVGESVLIRPYNTSGVIAFVGKTHFQVSCVELNIDLSNILECILFHYFRN